MKITIQHSPSNSDLWEKLCLQSSNLVQSQRFDSIQKFYNQLPVYFELWDQNQLLAGVKCYLYESTKWKLVTASLSRRLTQMSEFMIQSDCLGQSDEIKNQLNEAVLSYLKNNKVTLFVSFGIYNSLDWSLKITSLSPNVFSYFTSYVDINKTDEELINSFNRNTKRNIEKAKQAGVVFETTDDVDRFLKIEEQVYAQQNGVNPPNFEYIRYNVKHFPKENCQLAVATQDGVDLAGGLIYVHGEIAYSVFGGSVKNAQGAGHLFYYEWMKRLKVQGVKRFYFGQIAKEYDPKNEKFTLGITNFKRGFRCVEIETAKTTYILSPLKHKLWKLITALYGKV